MFDENEKVIGRLQAAEAIKNLKLHNFDADFFETGDEAVAYLKEHIAKGASMIAASVFSYILNKTLTFKVRKKTDTGMVVRFYIVFVLNLLANVSVNWLFYSLLQTKVIPFILATAAGMAVNFLGQKHFVFHKNTAAADSASDDNLYSGRQ